MKTKYVFIFIFIKSGTWSLIKLRCGPWLLVQMNEPLFQALPIPLLHFGKTALKSMNLRKKRNARNWL